MSNVEILLETIQTVDEVTNRVERFCDNDLPIAVKNLFDGSLLGTALNIIGIADESPEYVKNLDPERVRLLRDYMGKATLPELEASLLGYAQQNRHSDWTMESQPLVDIKKATPAESIISAYLISEELAEGVETLI